MRIAALTLLLASFTVYPKDLGVKGEVYPIAEESIIQYFRDQSQNPESQELLKHANERIQNRAKAVLLGKAEGNVLPDAHQYHTFEYKPEFIVPKDIVDVSGNIIIPRGTRVNPLNKVKPKSDLVFIDARSKKQIKWLYSRLDTSKRNQKIILTAGSPLKLSKKLKQPVFYDQHAMYAKKFSLRALPTTITVKNQQLLIEEWPI